MKLAIKVIPVFGLSALAGSGAARHCDEGAKEAGTARCPKTSPRGLGASQANYRTVGL